MRGRAVARTASVELAVPPLTAPADSGIIDEIKLDVRDHDVPIGSNHLECCVDVNGDSLFAWPSFLCWSAPRLNRDRAIDP